MDNKIKFKIFTLAFLFSIASYILVAFFVVSNLSEKPVLTPEKIQLGNILSIISFVMFAANLFLITNCKKIFKNMNYFTTIIILYALSEVPVLFSLVAVLTTYNLTYIFVGSLFSIIGIIYTFFKLLPSVKEE